MGKEQYDYDLRFEIKDQETHRQHISLTKKALDVIKRDMIYFNRDYDVKNRSGFLNKVFQNYYLSFPLSPKVVLKNITKVNINKMPEKPEEKVYKSVVDTLHRILMKDSINLYKNKYLNEEPFKFRLDKKSLDIMESYEDAHFFLNYSPRKNGETYFLKMIFESYASLSKRERERVYFNDEINLIEKSIKENRHLNIKVNGKYTSVIPIELDTDANNGSSKFKSIEAFNEVPAGEFIKIATGIFGLYEIQGIKISHPLNDLELDILNMSKSQMMATIHHHISKKEKRDVKVKFDEDGITRFNLEEDDLKIVGIPIKGEKNTYIFKATESEIFWELFKYGSQAEILEPISFRNKLKAFYEHAARQYDDSNKKGDL